MAKFNTEQIKKTALPTFQQLLDLLADWRKNLYSPRPWPHYSKKGPGRKHQQGKIK